MTDIRCRACGDLLGSPIYRTQEPRCYVFQGGPDDPRTGLKFHTRAGLVLPRDTPVVQIAPAGYVWPIQREHRGDSD